MSRKPDSDSASRSLPSETPDENPDEFITNALRKLRPEDSPRSDAFETFYQAGYQAALVASQKQPARSNALTGFGWGAVGGAILAATILLSISGIPTHERNRPVLDSATTATVDSGSNDVAVVPQESDRPAEPPPEKFPPPIEWVSSPTFNLGSTLSLNGFWGNRGALDEKQRDAITIDEWARQRSWQPLWSLPLTGTPEKWTERVATSDHPRPRAASVWQLRKRIDEIAL